MVLYLNKNDCVSQKSANKAAKTSKYLRGQFEGVYQLRNDKKQGQ